MFGMYKQIFEYTAARALTTDRGVVGRYTGIPINCVSVFRLGRVLALFSRVKRHVWQKSIN